MVEVAVGAHLVNQGHLEGVDVYYWREGNREVDFVLHKGNRITAVEVKSGSKPFVQSGLDEFSRRYGSKTLLVGSSGVSLHKFLETPVRDWI